MAGWNDSLSDPRVLAAQLQNQSARYYPSAMKYQARANIATSLIGNNLILLALVAGLIWFFGGFEILTNNPILMLVGAVFIAIILFKR